jgi:5'-nucleotidase
LPEAEWFATIPTFCVTAQELNAPMNFLLTNDDGIDAPGLRLLVEVARDFGDVIVVAPDGVRSGCGHQVTNERPLALTNVRPNEFACDGTPADCVRLGLRQILPHADWVLSGVNDGGNLGIDVYMSGTVAAVREAVLLGTPGIALSQYVTRKDSVDWPSRAGLLRTVLAKLLDQRPPENSFWNVNFPIWEPSQPEPQIIDCQLDLNRHDVRFEPHEDRWHYRGIYRDRPRTAGHDVDVCFSGHIALTKLTIGG